MYLLYKIKVIKDNVELIINDLNINLTGGNSVIISDEDFDKSEDIKKITKYISIEHFEDVKDIIEEKEDKPVEEKTTDEVFIKKVDETYKPKVTKEDKKDKIFIANKDLNSQTPNATAFVKEVEEVEEVEAVKETKTEDKKEDSEKKAKKASTKKSDKADKAEKVDKKETKEVKTENVEKKEKAVEDIKAEPSKLDAIDNLIAKGNEKAKK